MPSTSTHSWLGVRALMTRYGVRSPSTIWNWVAKGLLPKPHHIRQRAVWPEHEIAAADARLIQPPPGAAP